MITAQRPAREYNPSIFDLSQLNPLFSMVEREEGYSGRRGRERVSGECCPRRFRYRIALLHCTSVSVVGPTASEGRYPTHNDCNCGCGLSGPLDETKGPASGAFCPFSTSVIFRASCRLLFSTGPKRVSLWLHFTNGEGSD